MKDDLQDEKDSLEQKYQTLLNSSTKSRHMETSTPRSNKKRHRRRGAAGSGSLNQSGYSSSEEEVVGGGPVNGSRTDSALPESDPSFSRGIVSSYIGFSFTSCLNALFHFSPKSYFMYPILVTTLNIRRRTQDL